MSDVFKPLRVRIAEAKGYQYWVETRGIGSDAYKLAVCRAPKSREPWATVQNTEEAKKRYQPADYTEARGVGFYNGDPTPNWPTSIIDAWRLVEEMGEAFHGLLRGAAGTWVVGLEGVEGGCYGDTPCEAICLAWLNWRGVADGA